MDRIPATTMISKLKSKLAIIARTSSNTGMCMILEKMLDRGELGCAPSRKSGGERFHCYFSGTKCSLLDEIGDVPDETQRALLDLLAEGKVEFAIDDARGPNLYWWATPDGRAVH
jgi:hypothetical protein